MALAKFHLDQRIGQRPKAHSAMLDWDEGQPQALRARLLAQFWQHVLERATVGHFLFSRNAFFLHPFAHALADFFCLFRYRKIDGHLFAPYCF